MGILVKLMGFDLAGRLSAGPEIKIHLFGGSL